MQPRKPVLRFTKAPLDLSQLFTECQRLRLQVSEIERTNAAASDRITDERVAIVSRIADPA
jgi:hypothetical protein